MCYQNYNLGYKKQQQGNKTFKMLLKALTKKNSFQICI